MTRFLADNNASAGIMESVSKRVEALWNEYKLPSLVEGCSIISADFGLLGSLVIREIDSFDENVSFKYERGNYDYISVITKSGRYILWTDYEYIEPYNRQGGLYCDGATFSYLGEPVKETETYREFDKSYIGKGSISFDV